MKEIFFLFFKPSSLNSDFIFLIMLLVNSEFDFKKLAPSEVEPTHSGIQDLSLEQGFGGSWQSSGLKQREMPCAVTFTEEPHNARAAKAESSQHGLLCAFFPFVNSLDFI